MLNDIHVIQSGLLCILHILIANGIKCSFDTDNCGWTADSTASFPFTRQKGVASSGDLAGDHTTAAASKYTYSFSEYTYDAQVVIH